MLAQGVHPKIVQERLGHSNIAMTLNRYAHVSMDMQREPPTGWRRPSARRCDQMVTKRAGTAGKTA